MGWMLAVCPVLGIIAMAMSLSHLLPVATSLILGDGTTGIFLASMGINFGAGALLWLATRGYRHELQMREGILLIILVWVGGALFATAPLYFGIRGISFTDAYFESMSGLTATGATLLEGLDQLAPSINVWRAELQWLGGMGVIVLVVAILPMVGVGGRQISKAEIPGPMKDEALTPRMTQTAKGLWIVYVALTAACLLAYRAAGMPWLDALIHSFTTLSLGRFLVLRRESRLLQLAPDRVRVDGFHAARRHQLRLALPGVAGPQPCALPPRFRAALLSRRARRERARDHGLPAGERHLPRLARCVPPRGVSHHLGRHQYRLRNNRLQFVAGICAAVADVPRHFRRVLGFRRRRQQA